MVLAGGAHRVRKQGRRLTSALCIGLILLLLTTLRPKMDLPLLQSKSWEQAWELRFLEAGAIGEGPGGTRWELQGISMPQAFRGKQGRPQITVEAEGQPDG